MPSRATLPPDVLDAIRRGQQLEAIKRLRKATGLGLKEAKEAIDAAVAGKPISTSRTASVERLPPVVAAALQRGDKIEAIKLLREATGLGLKEAKDWVEASTQPLDAIRRLSPGEVPRKQNGMWWAIGVVLLAAAAYWALRSA